MKKFQLKRFLVSALSLAIISFSALPSFATVATATATQTTSLSMTLNGTLYKLESSKNIASQSKAFNDVITLPSGSFVTIMSVSSTAGLGTLATIGAAVIINDDTTNPAIIELTKSSADTVRLQLDPGEAILIGNSKLTVSETAASYSAFQDITSVKGKGSGGAVAVRVLAIGT